MSVFISMGVYVAFSIVALYMFGSGLLPDVLDNIGREESDIGSFIIRAAFLIVVGCHLPFVFFGCKDCFLIVLDEIARGSVSKSLEIKLAHHNKKSDQ